MIVNGKFSQAAKCVKSRIMIEFVDSILSIETFEQQCSVLKGMLQSPCLKGRIKTIGIDQSVRNRDSFEHKCFNNIKKIYKHAGKCDDQQIFKDIIEADMVSTPE